MITQKFRVFSLEKLGTLNQDLDVGVVRVPAVVMRSVAKRNSLVRISVMEGSVRKKSLVRIIRAATGEGALKNNEIALQYDDRRTLGIPSVGSERTLEIKRVHEWTHLPAFLLRHSSPLVRREAAFGLVLMVLGAIAGFCLGKVV